jgi:putative oxidoreductase
MTGLREFARPMLASIFVVQGLDTFRNPEKVSALAESVVRPVAARVPAVPEDTEQAVRINGAVQVVAGTTLGLGLLPRLSALALAATLVPTTLAGHRYWEVEDPQQRAQQRIHFLKNVTMIGGLLIAAADTAGNPSLAWRRRKAAESASSHLSDITQAVIGSARTGGDQISAVSTTAADSVRTAGDQLSQATQVITDAARVAASYLSEIAETLGDSARKATDRLPEVTQSAVESAKAAAGEVAQATQTAAGQVAQAAQSAMDSGRRATSQLTG